MQGSTGDAAPPGQLTYRFHPLKLLRLGSILATWGLLVTGKEKESESAQATAGQRVQTL